MFCDFTKVILYSRNWYLKLVLQLSGIQKNAYLTFNNNKKNKALMSQIMMVYGKYNFALHRDVKDIIGTSRRTKG